jgi:16S rRNA (cytosine1402-N4)-methyltransferase
MEEFRHTSVLLHETIDSLRVKPDGIYVDGTVGGGGHALEVCRLLSRQGRLIGIDQDGDAIKAAQDRLKEFKDRVTIQRSNYCAAKEVLKEMGIEKVDGILLDLGVSSHQLDDGERGFSYREDAPLDMRMDTRQEFTARDVVNTYGEEDLYRILRDYGEERFAGRIAGRIVREREKKPV